ncbi:hypothetical protein [Prosthecobacter fluviatilis]|uniref:Uncharacterized protein n=1 Tax=Prosthecobacter fluviatilis TaxID=445931 RepID=A0ABW0KUQ2_9BACT
MTPAGRIAAFVLLTAAAAAAALWATRETLRPRETPQEIGLRWLKDEYHLDTATFEKVSALHRDYFRQCDNMCRQINEADRPLLWRARHQARTPGDFDAQLARDHRVCADCEKAATEHLRQVAALMPAAQGRRFLQDILPVMQQQRRQHDQNLPSSTRR